MPWNLGLVVKPESELEQLYILTEFDGLVSLPTGWSKTAGAGSPTFTADGVGSTSGAITLRTTIPDPAYTNKGLVLGPGPGLSMAMHLKRTAPTGGADPSIGILYRSGDDSDPHDYVTLLGGAGYNSGLGGRYGTGIFRTDNDFNTDATNQISTPHRPLTQELWLGATSNYANNSRFLWIANEFGGSALASKLLDDNGDPFDQITSVTFQSVTIQGAVWKIRQTLVASSAFSLPTFQTIWADEMGWPGP